MSSLPRYNREDVPVTVGLGLYSTELEKAILGKKEGEAYTAAIDGASVKGTILSVRRREVPEDPASLEFCQERDGADSYAAWQSLQISKALEQRKASRLRGLYRHLTMQMNERCQPQLDPEELSKRTEENFRALMKQHCDIFGCAESEINEKSRSVYREQAEGSAQWEMSDALIGQAMEPSSVPEGEDEIACYAQVFRTALHNYCEALLNGEEEAQ